MELSGKLSKNRALSGSILRSTGGGGGAVSSVNGQTGDVVLDAQDVGALPDNTPIPSKTSDLTNDSGFVNASGAAAAAPVQSVNGQTGAVTVSGLSQAAKEALMDCFANTAWAVNNGQTYYDALASALGLRVLSSITAVFTQGSATIYDTDSLDTLKQYLVVTANYSDSTTATVTDYALSGTLTAGTSTITVSYSGKTDTFSVSVTSAIWYQTANEVLNNDRAIDTGINLFADGDKDFTIVCDFISTGQTSGQYWRLFSEGLNASPYPGAAFMSDGNNGNGLRVQWMTDSSNVMPSLTYAWTGPLKVAYTHKAGSGAAKCVYKFGTSDAVTVNRSAAYHVPTGSQFYGPLRIAQGSQLKGTVNEFIVYRTTFTDEQLAAYVG